VIEYPANEARRGANLGDIDAGGVCFHDINTSAFSQKISPDRLVTIGIDYARVGDRVFGMPRFGGYTDTLVIGASQVFEDLKLDL